MANWIALPETLTVWQAWLAVVLLLILFFDAARFFVEVLR